MGGARVARLGPGELLGEIGLTVMEVTPPRRNRSVADRDRRSRACHGSGPPALGGRVGTGWAGPAAVRHARRAAGAGPPWRVHPRSWFEMQPWWPRHSGRGAWGTGDVWHARLRQGRRARARCAALRRWLAGQAAGAARGTAQRRRRRRRSGRRQARTADCVSVLMAGADCGRGGGVRVRAAGAVGGGAVGAPAAVPAGLCPGAGPHGPHSAPGAARDSRWIGWDAGGGREGARQRGGGGGGVGGGPGGGRRSAAA